MAGSPNKYLFERVSGSPELEALQDRLGPLFEKLSSDSSSTADSIDDTASYEPAAVADWAAPPPTTISEALDRIAAVLNTAGTPA